jgi:hypothetical protein
LEISQLFTDPVQAGLGFSVRELPKIRERFEFAIFLKDCIKGWRCSFCESVIAKRKEHQNRRINADPVWSGIFASFIFERY